MRELVDRYISRKLSRVPQERQMIAIAHGHALASNETSFTVNDGVGFPNTLNNMYNA